MRNMRESLVNNIEEKFSRMMGDMAIKITDKAVGKCIILGLYEPKFPIELLKSEVDK